MSKRWVYGFHELEEATEAAGGDWDDVRGLLGGKGANLADMTRLGVAVPVVRPQDAHVRARTGWRPVPATPLRATERADSL